MRLTIKERFEKYISPEPNSGCWFWTGCCSSNGRPHFRINGVMVNSSRVSYELYKGAIIDNLWVLHTCDNGLCVNPDHLYLGTPQQNITDMVSRDRQAKGLDAVNNHKIDQTIANDIRTDRNFGFSYKDLMDKYNLSKSTISDIVNRKTWNFDTIGL